MQLRDISRFLKWGAKSRTCAFLNNLGGVKSHPCHCVGGVLLPQPLDFQHLPGFHSVDSQLLFYPMSSNSKGKNKVHIFGE